MGFFDLIIMTVLVAGSLYVLYRHFTPSGKGGCAGCSLNGGSCGKQGDTR